MFINIEARHINLGQSLNFHVHEKLSNMLNAFSENIHKVDVFLTDVNGPKGGEDMQCNIRVHFRNKAMMFAKARSQNMYHSVNACSHKIRKTVKRQTDKLSRSRQRGRNPFIRESGATLLSS